ncbi:hypothetical protein ACIPW5_13625 [Streptomyces sp. NPDC090077]|uniref:hypothetical protein n=1 Tax=Streptomyces sp. NPDC090077 TaxID=3365938 RepID=UPI00380D7B6E
MGTGTRRVVVQAPDARGLRAVTVDGEPAGSAWSPADLRRQLCRAGLPADTDLSDRSRVSWRGADAATWPDRAGRRHAVMAGLAAGLLVSALLLARVGMVDALGALTFSARLAGMLFVLAGAVQVVAVAAVLDFWGKRTVPYAGAAVLVGVLVTVGTEALLLGVWFQEREWTPYLPVFLALAVWAVWASWTVWRERAWQGIPHPKSFTAGVVATAVLASANFAYSAVYQPSAALFHFKVEAKFGTPRKDAERPVAYLPVKLRVTNDGAVSAYVVNSIFWVWGREALFDAAKTRLDQDLWRVELESGGDTELHVRPTGYTLVDTGPVVQGEGAWIAPGTDFTSERVVQVPTDKTYDIVMTRMSITFMRGDRGVIDSGYYLPILSWKEKPGRYFDCREPCSDHVIHYGRVRHNNNIVNVTRRPRYLTSIRWVTGTESGSTSLIAPLDSGGRLSKDYESADRYGVTQYDSGLTMLPYAELVAARP